MGTGWLTRDIHGTFRRYSGKRIKQCEVLWLPLWWEFVPGGLWEKGGDSAIPKAYRCKKTIDRPSQVRMDCVREDVGLGHDYLP